MSVSFGGLGSCQIWVSHAVLEAATVPELNRFLSSPEYLYRAGAARRLVNRKEQPAVVWPRLVAARADESWMVRVQVPRAAVHLGAPAAEAVPALRELLDDPDAVVQFYAAWALERLGEGRQADILAELARQGRRRPSKAAEPGAAADRAGGRR